MNVFELFATLKLDTSDYDKGLNNAKKDTTSLKDSLSNAGKTFSAIGAGIGVAGGALFAFANNSAQSADEIDKMSQKLGLSAQAYQEWDYVMQLAGTDINSMTTGMKTLVNKFEDAKGGSEDATKMFEQLGLSMSDISDMSQEDLFAAVISSLQGMEDNTERAALANDLLGRSATELRPLLNQTSEATQEQIQALHDMGGVMSDEAVKNGAAFQDSLTSLKTAFGGAANSLAGELIPKITSLADKITKFVSSGGLTKMLDIFKKLAPVIAGVTTAMVAYKTATAISGVITALTKATEGQTIAQALLNAVMNANPFVLVATAIAGLVTAIGVLWATNEDFRNAVLEIWGNIQEFIGGVVDAVKGFFEALPDAISAVWDTITGAVQNAFDGIKNFVSNAFDGIKEGAGKMRDFVGDAFLKAKEKANDAWSDAKSKFANRWSEVKNAFSNVASWFSTAFTEGKNKASGAWSDIKSKFENIWGDIKSAFGTAGEWFSTSFNEFKEKAANAWSDIKSKFDTIWENIKSAFNIADAFNWGKDLVTNFINGIKEKAKALTDELKGLADKIKKLLGFSEPEEGPLSDFHTYAPDMMKLFAQGIRDNANLVTDQIKKTFDFSNQIGGGVSAGAGTFNAGGVTINIYTRDGQNAKAIADEIDYRIAKSVEAKKAVWGMS